MTPIEKLAALVKSRYPQLTTDVSKYASGNVWLDIRLRDQLIAVVEFRPEQGFGISGLKQVDLPLSGYGEGPDEVLSDHEAAEKYLLTLLNQILEPRSGT